MSYLLPFQGEGSSCPANRLTLCCVAMKSPRLPIALQQAVMHCLRDKLARANQRLDSQYPEPHVVYQQRGTVWLALYEIRLNSVLLLENQQDFVDEVVPHELAHLLVWKYFGRVAPHGKEWKWMMESVLGVPAHRTHRFNVDSVRSGTFPYYCSCQPHQLTIRRRNRVLRGEAEYRCTRCGHPLRPQSVESNNPPVY